MTAAYLGLFKLKIIIRESLAFYLKGPEASQFLNFISFFLKIKDK